MVTKRQKFINLYRSGNATRQDYIDLANEGSGNKPLTPAVRKPYQTKTIEIIVDGKKYVFSAPQAKPGTKELLKKLIKGINKWKKNPTPKNWNKIFAEAKPLVKGKPTQYKYGWSTHLRNYLQGKPVESSVAKGIFDQSNIRKLLNISEADVSKIKGYTDLQSPAAATAKAALRTTIQKGTNDYPEIVKIFDKYKYNTSLSNLKNQDALIAQLKKNPIIAARFKQQGVPLTLKNLRTRIARTHNAVIKNTLDKGSYAGLFEGLSTADRQNFLNNAQKMFGSTINRSFQGQLIDTLKGNELKLASDKLSKFSTLRKFLSDRMGHMGSRHEAFIQLDHPISLAALDKSKNLNEALRVNPIAGDINKWKNKIDKRLNILQANKDVKGLRAINEVNQVLFGKGSPSFTAGAEGISKIKGLPADFRKANVLEQLRGELGLHEKLKTNIQNIKPETWKASGLNQAKLTSSLEALKSWKPEVLNPLIEEWTQKNPKFTKILEKRIGCQSGCLAAVANESPAAFSEALKKTPSAARSFLGMLGRGGARVAPFAAIAAVGAAAEPLVKQFRNDDYSTYLSDPEQQGSMLLAMVEQETPKVDQEILKWKYPGEVAAIGAGAIPGAGALYKQRRAIRPDKLIGPMPKGVGPARAALGISGVLGKALGATFSPLAVAATLPFNVAAQRSAGTDYSDIVADPGTWMGPAFASTGAQMATKGIQNPMLLRALRLGFSPGALRMGSRFLGLPGLALTGGMWAYDKWKNKDKDDEFKVRTYKEDD